jgi:hypothetical protein
MDGKGMYVNSLVLPREVITLHCKGYQYVDGDTTSACAVRDENCSSSCYSSTITFFPNYSEPSPLPVCILQTVRVTLAQVTADSV